MSGYLNKDKFQSEEKEEMDFGGGGGEVSGEIDRNRKRRWDDDKMI